ncbi:MAG: thiol-disulfide isomerase/thioredoxin [Verrucomicrobiales bacterium]|jgi:thiol-disulfide isomerase/thioredoxin
MRLLPAILIFATTCSIPDPASASESGIVSQILEDKLVRFDPKSGEIRPYQLQDGGQTEYFMIYFSAHWCGPCRKMTPALVKFYQETKATHPEFEIILISADHSKEGMQGYLEWAQMPWPAVAWEHRDEVSRATDLAPNSIPFMAMLDKQGKLLGASDLGGFQVGIPTLLKGLQAELGTEVYDIHERHGKKSPFVLVAYAVAAIVVLIAIVRRLLRRARGGAT